MNPQSEDSSVRSFVWIQVLTALTSSTNISIHQFINPSIPIHIHLLYLLDLRIPSQGLGRILDTVSQNLIRTCPSSAGQGASPPSPGSREAVYPQCFNKRPNLFLLSHFGPNAKERKKKSRILITWVEVVGTHLLRYSLINLQKHIMGTCTVQFTLHICTIMIIPAQVDI